MRENHYNIGAQHRGSVTPSLPAALEMSCARTALSSASSSTRMRPKPVAWPTSPTRTRVPMSSGAGHWGAAATASASIQRGAHRAAIIRDSQLAAAGGAGDCRNRSAQTKSGQQQQQPGHCSADKKRRGHPFHSGRRPQLPAYSSVSISRSSYLLFGRRSKQTNKFEKKQIRKRNGTADVFLTGT